MANEIKIKVSTAKPAVAGGIFMAPMSAVMPTDATSELGEGFVNLGAVSDDGVKNNTSRKVGSIKDWSGTEVLAPQEEFTDTFSFTLLDCKDPNVLKAAYGDSKVTGNYEAGIKLDVSPDELEYKAWVIDTVLSEGDLKRIVIPKAKVTDIAEITYKNNDAIGYGLTLNASPDSTNSTHHEYIIKKPSSV